MQFLDAIIARRSEFSLSKDIQLTDKEVESLISDMLEHTPAAFNKQSQSVLLLLGEKHEAFWDHLADVMKTFVPAEQFVKTKAKMNAFKAAFGTILFYEDMSVIEELADKFPLYKEKFNNWSYEQSGSLQTNIWVALRTKHIGASLQHYNELIEDYVKDTYNLPQSWELRGQMPFGKIIKPAAKKDKIDVSKRFLIEK